MMRGLVAALVVTAAALMTAAGCNSSVVVASGCPGDKPVTGAACDAPGESCQIQDGPCEMTFTCGSGAEQTWKASASTCNPAAVDCWSASEGDVCANPGESCGEGGECGGFENICGDDHRWHTAYLDGGDCCYDECCYDGCWCEWTEPCPATPPFEGEPCDPECQYDTCTYGEGMCGATSATCGADYAWHLLISDCPPPDPCPAQGTELECLNAGCRWLVPGCGEPPLPKEGCYAPFDCAPGDCAGPNSTCQQVVTNPCWNQACDACGALVSVCLP